MLSLKKVIRILELVILARGYPHWNIPTVHFAAIYITHLKVRTLMFISLRKNVRLLWYIWHKIVIFFDVIRFFFTHAGVCDIMPPRQVNRSVLCFIHKKAPIKLFRHESTLPDFLTATHWVEMKTDRHLLYKLSRKSHSWSQASLEQQNSWDILIVCEYCIL